ncbi:MAG: ATP-dependent zinc metalloprotease FtsH [bacterium]
MVGFRSATLWIVIFLLFILFFYKYSNQERPKEITIAEWLDYGKAGRIIEAKDRTGRIDGKFMGNDNKEVTYLTEYSSGQSAYILWWVTKYNVPYSSNPQSTVIQQLVISLLLPFLLFVGLWILLMRQIQSGGNKAMSFGKSRAKLVSEGQTKVTFDDVAGVDEAKEELREVVEFLKDPKKFSRLGAKIPKGVLLYGPPGTGKTMLAKAVAGEANVPFFSISGSDFVEMFVGVGASRVRDLFEQGKKNRPCLIFIDEIDAVGRHRFAGIGGGHDEREQTLNQLLVEMDGFSSNEGVILIAATNRPDVLDPALLRPGRFDRQITVDFPDVAGREKILQVHAKGIKVEQEVKLKVIAKATPGFSGADLANLVNEAALLAARRNKAMVAMDDLEEAKDRVMMGPERRSLVLSEKEKRNTAYHEAGHALCAKLLPGCDPVHKVTIIPRGRALGLTSILPEEDRHSQTKRDLKIMLVYMMGGRAAEKLVFDEFTTGAGNDLSRATAIAHRMVCEFGMSDRLGPRTFGEPGSQIFLGKELARERNYSDSTAALIDEEIHKIVNEAYETALRVLTENRDKLVKVSEALVERETLDSEELDKILKGEELGPVFKKTEPPSATPQLEEEKEKSPKLAPNLAGIKLSPPPSEQPS